ncbi:MAG: hypothetical protein IJE11_00130 [Bacteroidales bacterium]|nr:hypothetical protein [Bacteroidales bacterium]
MEDNRLELSRELEEMRQQFAVMKERFDHQEIVNDGLLRNMQKRRINLYDWLNLYGPMIVIVAMLPLMYLCCRDYGLPVWVAVMVYVVAATEIIWQYLERRKYRKVFSFEGDVLQSAGCVRRFRRRTFKMKVLAGAVLVLVLAVGVSVWLPNVRLTDDPFRWALCILLVLGVFAVNVAMEIKSFRLLDSIIKDLEQ